MPLFIKNLYVQIDRMKLVEIYTKKKAEKAIEIVEQLINHIVSLIFHYLMFIYVHRLLMVHLPRYLHS